MEIHVFGMCSGALTNIDIKYPLKAILVMYSSCCVASFSAIRKPKYGRPPYISLCGVDCVVVKQQ